MSPKIPANQLIIARSLSEFGNAFRLMSLPLGILKVSGHPRYIALAELTESLFAVAAGFVVPFFVDRIPKRNSLIISDFFSLICTLALGMSLYLESITLLVFVAALMAGGYVLHDSALSAATSDLDLLGTEQSIIKGFSKLQLFTLLVGILGAFVGSKLIASIPLWSFFVVDAISFLVSSVWVYFLIRPGFFARKEASKTSMQINFHTMVKNLLGDWVAGFNYCVQNPVLKRLIISQSLVAVSHGLLAGTVVGHYKSRLNATDEQVGDAQINNRIWQVLGALFRVKFSFSPRAIMFWATLLMSIGYFGMYALKYFWIFILFYGFQQFGNALLMPTNRALCMSSSAIELRGRVASFRGLAIDIGILSGNALALYLLSVGFSENCFLVSGLVLFFSLVVRKNVQT